MLQEILQEFSMQNPRIFRFLKKTPDSNKAVNKSSMRDSQGYSLKNEKSKEE